MKGEFRQGVQRLNYKVRPVGAYRSKDAIQGSRLHSPALIPINSVAEKLCYIELLLKSFLSYIDYLAIQLSSRPVRERVSTDGRKFHAGPQCPTLIRPAGGLRLSSSPLDTPSRTGLLSSMIHFQIIHKLRTEEDYC
jgi:hypothetical protein